VDGWLTISQVALLAGCGRSSVHRALVRHELPHAWTDLGRLVAEADAIAWAADREAEEDDGHGD
jgi:hypothetical protein